jgi:hypothetical protein
LCKKRFLFVNCYQISRGKFPETPQLFFEQVDNPTIFLGKRLISGGEKTG